MEPTRGPGLSCGRMTTPDSTAPDTAALLKTWIQGWAASRACAPAVADGDGWRVEVDWPQQVRRHVFPRLSDRLRELGDTIIEPWVYLKACVTADELRAVLPPRWTVQPPSFFMSFDGPGPAATPLAPGYELTVETEADVQRALIHDAQGTLAADGRMVSVGSNAIFDRIGTDAAHRRRGLGRAVMCALHAAACERGLERGLLAATLDGHALYTPLGWRVQSPYASAVIVGD